MNVSKLTKTCKKRFFVTKLIMRIRNISIKSIEARRYIKRNERPKKVRIDHNSTVNLFSDIKENSATIDFQYTASYGPVGVIKLEGSLFFEDDKVDKIAKQWNDTRKMPNQVASQIHTAIMHACVPQAVGIAKDLALPPPIPLPQVRLGDSQKTGQSQSGPEIQ
jgi:hypothetical protein